MTKKREPLLRSQVGKKVCRPQGPLKLCIEGHKYGFSAWLYSKDGKHKLPVSTGDARTMSEAVKQAERFLAKVYGRNN